MPAYCWRRRICLIEHSKNRNIFFGAHLQHILICCLHGYEDYGTPSAGALALPQHTCISPSSHLFFPTLNWQEPQQWVPLLPDSPKPARPCRWPASAIPLAVRQGLATAATVAVARRMLPRSRHA